MTKTLRRLLILATALPTGLWAIGASAESSRSVNSPAELYDALEEAQPGATLSLAPGDFGVLKISGTYGTPDRPLTLRASDPADPPRISELVLRDVDNLIIESFLFDYTFRTEDKSYFRPFQIVNSRNIVLRDSVFDGDLVAAIPGEAPAPTGFALGITDSRNVDIIGNEFRAFLRGILVAQSNGIVIRENNLHSLRSDGLNFAEVQDVLIENNHIHDFDRLLAAGDHADFIQFWTAQTETPSTDVIIRGNVLNSGNGWYTQSIFIRNEVVDTGLAGREMFYRSFIIEDNVIINAHLHGITVGETDGLTIRNNSLIRNRRSEGPDNNPPLWTPVIRITPSASNVEITGNVTNKIEGYADQPDWTVENNFLIQDREPEKPGYYDQVFVGGRTGDPNRLESFAPLPGGPLDGSDMGSSLLASLVGKAPSTAPAAVAPRLDLLSLDSDDDALTVLSGEQIVALTHPSIANGVLQLAGQASTPTVPSDVIAPLFGARDFTLSFRIKGSGDYGKPGEILYVPKTLRIAVTGRGALDVDIIDLNGTMRNVKSPGARLYEANWRDIAITYSQEKKSIAILIDGNTVAERPFDGLPDFGKWDLTFGNPTDNDSTFIGALSNLHLRVNTDGLVAKE